MLYFALNSHLSFKNIKQSAFIMKSRKDKSF